MKDRTLYIFLNGLEGHGVLFEAIRAVAPFNVVFMTLEEFLSPQFRARISSKRPSDIILSGEAGFLALKEEAIKGYFESIFRCTMRNIVFIHFDAEFYHAAGALDWGKNYFLLSDEPLKHTQQAINFNLFMLKLFRELTMSERLDSFIVDSFSEIVNSEILKGQNGKIEQLNRELDVKNARLLNDLKMAQRVQMSLIPQYEGLDTMRGLNFGFKYSPMESLGGDLFDILRIGKNRYGVLIFDVSGHGVSAALITIMAKYFFNAHRSYGITPGEVCQKVHREINEAVGDLYYYITAFYGILDTETGTLQYTNAGHQPSILFNGRSGKREILHSNSTLVGILQDPVYETREVAMEKGDRLLCVTDGIIEAKNPDGELYGLDRLERFAVDGAGMSVDSFIEALMKDVEDFSRGVPQDDDRAAIIVEFASSPLVKRRAG